METPLPPYLPHLNPIEFGWRDVKMELSGIFEFERVVQEAKLIAPKLFNERRPNYITHYAEIRSRQKLTD